MFEALHLCSRVGRPLANRFILANCVQVLALTLAFFGFYLLKPFIRGKFSISSVELPHALASMIDMELPWFTPFIFIFIAVLGLHWGKQLQFSSLPLVSSSLRQRYLEFSAYVVLTNKQRNSLDRAIKVSAKVVRWFLLSISEFIRVLVATFLILLFDPAAIMPLMIVILGFATTIFFSYRQGKERQSNCDSEDFFDFIQFRMLLQTVSLTFNNSMPAFLLAYILWSRLNLADNVGSAQVFFLCMAVAYIGTSASGCIQSVIRIIGAGSGWKKSPKQSGTAIWLFFGSSR